MKISLKGSVVPICLILLLGACGGVSSYDDAPYTPESSGPVAAEGPWEDVLSADPAYPDNVYLTELISFEPGLAGSSRLSDSEYYDDQGYPLENLGALGPPEGNYPVSQSSSDADMTILGAGGSAVWRFDPDYRIIDEEGDDFITFSNHNVFGGDPDNSWNELARVYISADGVEWYENSACTYTVHPSPGSASNAYDWDAVQGLHGNTHGWANFRTEVQAESFDSASHAYIDLYDDQGDSIWISRYFSAESEHLGGDHFDLADFVHTGEGDASMIGDSWPADGSMSYLKIVDDPAILDGQDWNPDWSTGARVMAAMGLNVVLFEDLP